MRSYVLVAFKANSQLEEHTGVNGIKAVPESASPFFTQRLRRALLRQNPLRLVSSRALHSGLLVLDWLRRTMLLVGRLLICGLRLLVSWLSGLLV